mgnify:CR=1 FL=1
MRQGADGDVLLILADSVCSLRLHKIGSFKKRSVLALMLRQRPVSTIWTFSSDWRSVRTDT